MMDKPRVVAIIQARMGSARLPGKVLLDIAGEPMLMHVVQRAQRAVSLDDVVVATTTEASDDLVADFLKKHSVPHVRGHPTDVLSRYMKAAETFQAEVVVRLTADCPLHDPHVIDQTVHAFIEALPDVDYASNRLVRTYPIGLDVEVFSHKVLENMERVADLEYQREHVTPYLYEAEGRARLLSVESDTDFGHHRWTVDTPEDLEFVRQVFARFPGRKDFGWLDVIHLLEREPALTKINAHIHHKTFRESENS